MDHASRSFGYWADVPTAMEPEITIIAATGRADSNSDVDLLIVEKRPFGPARSRRAELTRLWMALADVPTIDAWRGGVCSFRFYRKRATADWLDV